MTKINKSDIQEEIQRFAQALGVDWFPSINQISGRLDDFVILDERIDRLQCQVKREEFEALLDYLGIEMKKGITIVKKEGIQPSVKK